MANSVHKHIGAIALVALLGLKFLYQDIFVGAHTKC